MYVRQPTAARCALAALIGRSLGARGGLAPGPRLEPHRLVFLDETGTTTKMTRLRGRSPKGQRLLSKAPFGHWKTQTFIVGLRCDALTAPFVKTSRSIVETK